jgi:WD40 repeat protein
VNPQSPEPATAANPFVGPRAYGRHDRLYGRDGETEDLLDLLVAERVVLLHSPSGAGKTSLVQARLVPRLEEDGFRVYPIIRTTHELPVGLRDGVSDGMPAPNRYVLSTLMSFEEGLSPQLQRPVNELAALTIAQYLAEAPRPDGAPTNAVLIFDQFEEVVTANQVDVDAKVEFFTQVGAALRDRELWASFAIREDFLAELDPYSQLVPTRFANRYRLDLLGTDAALQAITRSAGDADVDFQHDAAVKLVDDLRRIRVQHRGEAVEELGPYVEPVQLQVVCRQIWDRLAPGARSIDLSDVAGVGDVNQALATYYAASIETTAARTNTPERLLRDWIDRELITPQGFRAQTLYGPQSSPLGNGAVLQALTDTHLLRAESRRGAVWYELAHDRFVDPVRSDNARWRIEHLSELERRAGLWHEQGRPDDLLLVGSALLEAGVALAQEGRELSGLEHEFLEASRRAQRQAVRMERVHRRTRWLTVAVMIMLLVVTALVAYSVSEKKARTRAEVDAMVGRAIRIAQWAPDLGMTLAVRAAKLSGADGSEPAMDLLQSLLDENRVVTPLRADGAAPRAVDFSHDGQLMVTGNPDGVVRVWTHAGGLVTSLKSSGGVLAVVFGPGSPNGPAIAVGSTNGLTVWSSPSDPKPRRIPSPTTINAVSLSPDGGSVVAGTGDGSIVVYNAASGTERTRLRRPGTGAEAYVAGVGWLPDGKQVVAIDSEGHLTSWDVASGLPAPVQDIKAHDRGAALKVAADGKRVVTGGDSDAVVWDLAHAKAEQRVYARKGFVQDVDLSSDGSRLLVLDSAGALLPFDAQTGTQLFASPDYGPEPLAAALDPTDPDRAVVATTGNAAAVYDVSAGHDNAPTALGTAADGTIVTAADDEGIVRLWSADGRAAGTLDSHTSGIRDAVLSDDGRFIAILAGDGRASVHHVRDGGPPYVVPGTGITAIALSRDGRFIATADLMTYAVTVSDTTGKVLPKVLTGHNRVVTGLDFGPSSDEVVSVSDDLTAVAWKGNQRVMNVRLKGSNRGDTPSTVAWSPDGSVIATAGRGSETPQVWDAQSGDLRFELHEHASPVTDIAFDRTGHRLVTVGSDQETAIWDVDQRTVLTRRSSPTPRLKAAFSADGKRLYTIGLHGYPYTVYLNAQELLDVASRIVTREISPIECVRYVRPAGRC